MVQYLHLRILKLALIDAGMEVQIKNFEIQWVMQMQTGIDRDT